MKEHEKHLISTLASNLLYGDHAQTFLMEAVWNQWTDDERRAFALAAHNVAMAKVESITTTKMNSYARPNAISQLIAVKIKAALEAPSVTGMIRDYVDSAVQCEMSKLPDTVRSAVTALIREILQRALSEVRYDPRALLDQALHNNKDKANA